MELTWDLMGKLMILMFWAALLFAGFIGPTFRRRPREVHRDGK